MINAIIVDDEPLALDVLETYIQKVPSVNLVSRCQNAIEATEVLKNNDVDLMFLDIQMPQLTGIEFMKTLKNPPKVIFTTAYSNYALDGYELNVMDYLLKPIDKNELVKAVETAQSNQQQLEDRLEELMREMQIEQTPQVAIPTTDGMEMISQRDIIHCESDSNYTHIHMIDGKRHTIAKTLKEVEEQLDAEEFIRVHQSHLVNFKHVSRYIKGNGGHLVMKDETEIPVSRRKKMELIERLH